MSDGGHRLARSDHWPRHSGGAGSRCHWMADEDYRDELAKLAGGRDE